MDAINTETGEVIAENLSAMEIEKLRSAGADVETQEAPDAGSSGDGDGTEPDAIADPDDSPTQDADLSKVDEHGADEVLHDDAVQDVDEDISEDARSELEWDEDDIDAPDTTDLDGFEEQYEAVRREEQKADTDTEQDRDKRNERIDSGRVKPDDDNYEEVGSQTVRDYLNETGQAEQIVEAFQQFKTEDRWVADKDGERLNTDAVVDLVSGDTGAQDRLFERKQKAETGNRVFGVSCDMSGSMKGVIKETKAAMGGVAMAARELGDDFVANGWTSSDRRGEENQIIIPVTLPDEDFEWEHLNALWPNYQDPITPGMRHLRGMVDEVSASEQVMVIITDGQPQMTAEGKYNAREAVAEAQAEVRKYRDEGYVVIGLGIEPGADRDLMEEMFGEGGYVMTDEENIADDLVAIYEAQVNVSGGR